MFREEYPQETSALNEVFHEFSVRYVSCGARARFRWNIPLAKRANLVTLLVNLITLLANLITLLANVVTPLANLITPLS